MDVSDLLQRMTLSEKIGQLQMVNASEDYVPGYLADALRDGRVGAIINQVNPHLNAELQTLAKQSRMGIPLLSARDVIHGFKTVYPIPLGQAATWSPDLVKKAARAAATEAASHGINWTFAPMLDISRDPRWGRIAESFGEDPYLTAQMGVAMVEGYQGDDLSDPASIAACAKHFAGYGAAEGGRDYNTANIPDNEMRNVYLPPFWAAIEAGVGSLMPSFSDVDGLPASVHDGLMLDVLRGYWEFEGLVVSDWHAVKELLVHGVAENYGDAATMAAHCRVDMEMASTVYADHLHYLVEQGRVSEALIDAMVGGVLRLKQRLGLLGGNRLETSLEVIIEPRREDLDLARQIARDSMVLLKNEHATLPLAKNNAASLAVIGPLADAPHDQMGTWVFDGDQGRSITPLKALQVDDAGHGDVHFAPGLTTSRDRSHDGFHAALDAAGRSDVVVAVLGEESILSGEAHCRADITLPGAQLDLLKALKATGKPVIAVIMAGRPMDLSEVAANCDALLFSFHGGSMTGPALVDLLYGQHAPSGRLPATFPRSVGQVPIHYNHKRTGRPTDSEEAGQMVLIDDIGADAVQTSLGMTSFYLDDGDTPLFPFGFGLSYAAIKYDAPTLDRKAIGFGDVLRATARIHNVGGHKVTETVQLYIRDHAGSLTRPVRELKSFQRVALAPGEDKTVSFEISVADLSFSLRNKTWGAEPGTFSIWIAPDAHRGEPVDFILDQS